MDSSFERESEQYRPRLGAYVTVLRVGAWAFWAGGILSLIWLEIPVGFPAAVKLRAAFYILFCAFIAGALPWTMAFVLVFVEQIRENVFVAARAWSAARAGSGPGASQD